MLESSNYIFRVTLKYDDCFRFQEYTQLLPCPLYNQPPRVEHLVVLEGGVVLDYISKALNLPPM